MLGDGEGRGGEEPSSVRKRSLAVQPHPAQVQRSCACKLLATSAPGSPLVIGSARPLESASILPVSHNITYVPQGSAP